MKLNYRYLLLGACTVMLATSSRADQRLFTYTYEPETMPKGSFEAEQWVTLRAGRNSTVGQEDHYKLEFREEFEYSFTDNYVASLYINSDYVHYKNPDTNKRTSSYRWTGVSVENKYMVLAPEEHAVGLSLYLEPTYDGQNFELEEKIILGQRHGDWKWALNLIHATEWTDDFRETEGEVELSFGLARQLSPRWSLGIEVRDHNEIPEYNTWENTAVYLGPVVSYHRERWWATLTVMPQIFGANFAENVDNDHHFELEGHERLNVRLIAGFSF